MAPEYHMEIVRRFHDHPVLGPRPGSLKVLPQMLLNHHARSNIALGPGDSLRYLDGASIGGLVQAENCEMVAIFFNVVVCAPMTVPMIQHKWTHMNLLICEKSVPRITLFDPWERNPSKPATTYPLPPEIHALAKALRWQGSVCVMRSDQKGDEVDCYQRCWLEVGKAMSGSVIFANQDPANQRLPIVWP
jgi:hypothetical protein